MSNKDLAKESADLVRDMCENRPVGEAFIVLFNAAYGVYLLAQQRKGGTLGADLQSFFINAESFYDTCVFANTMRKLEE